MLFSHKIARPEMKGIWPNKVFAGPNVLWTWQITNQQGSYKITSWKVDKSGEMGGISYYELILVRNFVHKMLVRKKLVRTRPSLTLQLDYAEKLQ